VTDPNFGESPAEIDRNPQILPVREQQKSLDANLSKKLQTASVFCVDNVWEADLYITY